MRKLMLVATLVVMMVPFFAAVAFAANQIIQCAGIPCIATGQSDLVYERIGNRLNDEIYLKGGSDQVRADKYRADRDLIYGSKGFDLIYTNDGDTNDRIRGGAGKDKCYVDARSEVVSGCSAVIIR
jgi:hypothetical protein